MEEKPKRVIRTKEQVAADLLAGHKVCTVCGEDKVLSEFYPSNNTSKYTAACRTCTNRITKEKRDKKVDPEVKTCKQCGETKNKSEFRKLDTLCKNCRKLNEPIYVDPESRVCEHCGEEKDIASFHRNGTKGYLYYCIDCYKEIRRKAVPETIICKRCGVEKPNSEFSFRKEIGRYRGVCKECKAEKNRERRRNNKLPENPIKVCYTCKEEKHVSEFHKLFGGVTNVCKLCCSKRKKENSIKYNAKSRETRKNKTEEEKEELRRRNREKYAENPENRLTWNRNYRARKSNVPGSHSQFDIIELEQIQEGICIYCYSDITKDRHVDHIIPLSRLELNPTNDKSNLQILCHSCNESKHARTHEEFVEWMRVNATDRFNIYMSKYTKKVVND